MNRDKDTLRDEYSDDLIQSGERGKYAKQYREKLTSVLIDPDLHDEFPDSESVNGDLSGYGTPRGYVDP